MNANQPNIELISATEKCEQYLNEVKISNIANKILPSENKVIDRLLCRSLDMKPVYEELVNKLSDRQFCIFINIILSSAAFWNPGATRKYRKDKSDLLATNNLISQLASELAEALLIREDLNNSSGFSSNTYYHICDVINAASQDNGHYFGCFSENIESLSCEYDLKYWPSLSNIVKAIAVDAKESRLRATDPLTDAATSTERTSKADYLKAFLASIDENTFHVGNGLPAGVKITDGSLSIIVNCALELAVDEIVDSSYVKGVRQRLRNAREE